MDVVLKAYKDQVHNDVFNRRKNKPEAIMFSYQPVTYKLKHQIRNRRSKHTVSSAARTSSWLNDLFSWAKDSISGLLSSKPEQTSTTNSSISQVDAPVDVNGTIMLLDVFIRKITGQKYKSSQENSAILLEAQAYTLNIMKTFEEVVEQAALKSGISMHRLNIDLIELQKEVTGKIMSRKFNEIAKVLSSRIEKACPGREAGCPSKLSVKKFHKFIATFNKKLNVSLNQSIHQMLHNENNVLNMDNTKEQSLSLFGPKTKLDDILITGNIRKFVAGRT